MFSRRISIAKRLSLAFMTMVALIAVIGFTGFRGAREIQQRLERIYSENLFAVASLLETDRDLQRLLVAERTIIFENSKSDLFRELVETHKQALEQADLHWSQYEKLAKSSQESEAAARYEQARDEWRGLSRQVVQARVEDSRAGRRLAIDLTLGAAKARFENMRQELQRLQEINLADAQNAQQAAAATYQRTASGFLALTVLGLACGVFLSWSIGRSINRPLGEAVAALRDIAEGEGDLTRRLATGSNDEVGEVTRWFNTFVEKIHALISEVSSIAFEMHSGSNSAATLATVASELREGSQALDEQATAVEGTAGEMSSNISRVAAASEQSSMNVRSVAASVEELSANLTSMSESSNGLSESVAAVASSISSMSGSLSGVSESCGEAMNVARRASEAAQQTSSTLGLLDESAAEIGKVVSVISGISAQTNLLALNATIEAASAGDAGRGFAVVANEVKELAKQTGGATEEIRSTIEVMQSNSREAVAAIQQIVDVVAQINEISGTITDSVSGEQQNATRITESIDASAKAASTIGQNVKEGSQGATLVARNAEELALASSEIAESVAEVSDGSGQVSAKMSEMARIAQQASSGATKVDDTSRAMAALSEQLNDIVGRFRL